MNLSDMSAVRYAQAAGDCDNMNHPNHPDHDVDYAAVVASETDALMAELGSSLSAAKLFADDWEALMDLRGELIYSACNAMQRSQEHAEYVAGVILIKFIRAAAERRVRHEMEVQSC